MARDLSAFSAICTTYRAAADDVRNLKADHETTWAANDWLKAHDRYWTLRTAAPKGVEPEAWMRETYPKETAIVDAIDAHGIQYRETAAKLVARLNDLQREALVSLAEVFAPELDLAAQERPESALSELMAEIFGEASILRKQYLDGGRLDFDPDGPFTRGILAPIADRMGVDRRKKHWPFATIEAHAQVAPTP